MNESTSTYKDLFALLSSLGFQQQSEHDGNKKRHIFLHVQTETVLAFGRAADEEVTSADLPSTKVHLQGRGITDLPLATLLNAAAVN